MLFNYNEILNFFFVICFVKSLKHFELKAAAASPPVVIKTVASIKKNNQTDYVNNLNNLFLQSYSTALSSFDNNDIESVHLILNIFFFIY